MKTMILGAVLAVALMLTGCGGGGSRGASMAGMPSGGGGGRTPTPQTYGPGSTIPLPTGHQLQTGTIPAGGSRTVVRETDGMERVIRCTAGSANCRITVAADGTVTLIAGTLRIEIVGVRVVTTPPTRVIEPPLVEPPPVSRGELPSWEELPALVDRMNHRTELRSGIFARTTCDDGVAACQALVKTVLAESRESGDGRIYGRTGWANYSGGWLENSIFIYTRDGTNFISHGARIEDAERVISMGIRDTNPVTGVYRGQVFSYNHTSPDSNFELTYTSGAAGGQLDMTVDAARPNHQDRVSYTWTNVSVDNEGEFRDSTPGGNKLEGRFYQGGEVGGVYSYRLGRYGAFGGKLVPASP